ncbi:FliA/WhiG family RNA polymerase sigma factor [bacterium]|jgi:RNA polymerase sigma factor FliA|nr:FliA/WhiG family RNA polymerase sigma factor [bacterium]
MTPINQPSTNASSQPKTLSQTVRGRNMMVLDHLYVVNFVVSRMSINLPPGMSRDDLISIGTWGLIDAANKFDESKGVLFKTYATTRVRGAILDELRRNSLGGQTLCRKARHLEKAVRKVEFGKDGTAATDLEVAKEMGVTVEKLHILYAEVARSFLVSLDDPTYRDDEGNTLGDSLPDSSSEPFKTIASKERKTLIKGVVQALPRQEQMVLLLYYYEELTFREIGLILSVSESRISQIHTKAIVRLRGRLKNKLGV